MTTARQIAKAAGFLLAAAACLLPPRADAMIPLRKQTLCDAMGNVRHLVDSQGAIVASYDYDSFGRLIARSGPSADACPLLLSTKYLDDETGLYYFGYRYYDPCSLKWLSRDPLGEAAGPNLTAFCRNDPVNNFDPLGLDVAAAFPLDGILGRYLSKWSGDHLNGYKGAGDVTCSGVEDRLSGLILQRMLNASTLFTVKGESAGDVAENLNAHIAARVAIVKAALRFNLGFGHLDKVRWRSFNDAAAALRNPAAFVESLAKQGYKPDCQGAAELVYFAALGSEKMLKAPDAEGGYCPCIPTLRRAFVEGERWIPGDWGYLANGSFRAGRWPVGTPGENLIMLAERDGKDLFWGHLPGLNRRIRSARDWEIDVAGWTSQDGLRRGTPVWDMGVDYPAVGLIGAHRLLPQEDKK